MLKVRFNVCMILVRGEVVVEVGLFLNLGLLIKGGGIFFLLELIIMMVLEVELLFFFFDLFFVWGLSF